MPKGVYPRTDEMRAHMSVAKRGCPAPGTPFRPGQAAFAGRTHSIESREKMRAAKLGKPGPWAGKKRGPYTVEWRQKIGAANRGRRKPEGFGDHLSSLLSGIPRSPETVAKMRATMRAPEMRALMASHTKGKPCRHSKHPVYYNGLQFRSTYEVRVAKALDVLGIAWEYESHRFDLGGTTYCPDFYLPDNDVFWEVKGWYGPDSERKTIAFRSLFPDIRLVVFTKVCIESLESAVQRAA